MVSDGKVENQAGASDGPKVLLLKSLKGYYRIQFVSFTKIPSCKR